MEKKFVLLVIAGLLTLGSFAQERTSTTPKMTSKYNKWSIDGGVGLTKPRHNFSPGFRASTLGFLSAELGARYMMNNLFGLRLGVGYSRFTDGDNSGSFSTDMFRADLQGVINAGRLLKFEEWTRTFGLLAHGGVGVGMLSYDTSDSYDDYVGNVLAGLTGKIRVSDRVAINLDVTGMYNIRQGLTFDGRRNASNDNTPIVLNGTIGLSYYIGRQSTHADWYYFDEKADNSGLIARISALESDLQRARSDAEARNAANMDNLNRRIDELNNKLATAKTAEADYNQLVAQLINEGYVNIFFDFNSSRIDNTAASAIGIIRTYLMRNPGVRATLTGYADEIGPEDFNKKLSQRRADAVADLLAKTGIERSRLQTEGKGEYTNVDKSSDIARRQARRVSFSIQ